MVLTAAVAIGVGEGVVARLDVMASGTALASEEGAYAIAPDETVPTEGAGLEGRGGEAIVVATPAPDRASADKLDAAAASPAARPTSVPAAVALPISTPAAIPVAPAATKPTAAPGPQRLPADVAPPLTKARKDSESIVRDKCSLAISGSKPPVCFYGPKDATLTVALVGDSHAAQWFPALERLADGAAGDWSRSPSTGAPSSTCGSGPRSSSGVHRVRGMAEKVVAELGRSTPTSSWSAPTAGSPPSTRATPTRSARGGDRPPHRPADGTIPPLADTPLSSYDVPACLSPNLDDIGPCTTPCLRPRLETPGAGARCGAPHGGGPG